MKKVIIELCPDYSRDKLNIALGRVLDPLGGIGKFVKPGQKVLLKPNLLRKARPEEAVTTHPSFVRAVVELVQGAGGKAMIGDSPGAALPHIRNILLKLYRACGLEKVAQETGAELILDTSHEMIPVPEGKMVKRIEIIKPALEAEVIINLPKFKTHVYTRLTGGVKNLFGLVPGLIKPAYHAKLMDVERFSSMLVDVMQLARPALTIVDGVWGMEGDGPGSGPVRKMGLIMAGESPPAVDVALSWIMGIDPLAIPTVRETVERGIIKSDFSDLEVCGQPLAGVIQKNMKVPSPVTSGISFARFPFWLQPFLPLAKRLLTIRPRIKTSGCLACGECVRVCPVKAIRIKDGKAVIDYKLCIRCYCCHETCYSGAIDLITPILQRFFV